MDYSKYKVLFFDSTIIGKNDMIWGLLELGFDVERAKTRVNLMEISDEEVESILTELDGYDFAAGQNFSASLAEACYRKRIPYISWVYDSPQAPLYRKEAKYDTNYIFAFDKTQVNRIKAIGCERIYYQPLAANMAITSMLNITDDDIRNFYSEVSFVGKIYKQSVFDEIMQSAPDNVKADVESLYNNIACRWGKDLSPLNYLKDESINYLRGHLDRTGLSDYEIDEKFLSEVLLIIPPLAGYERREFLKRSGSKFNTKIYTTNTPEELSDIPGIKICPKVDYDSDMYKVFYSSKININLTLRSIETGIPQRVFDIMSVGGPVFSNYQEEIEELFVIDKDIITFNSLDEFEDKAKYYLKHDDERVKIGINGYYRVRDEYNYVKIMAKMFDIVQRDK